jgi:hypothetical protein
MGAVKRHKILLNLMLDFKREYRYLSSTFALMHFIENSHNSNEKFNWVDKDLFQFLQTGYYEGILKRHIFLR